jgi:hypothetical protein
LVPSLAKDWSYDVNGKDDRGEILTPVSERRRSHWPPPVLLPLNANTPNVRISGGGARSAATA